MLRSVRCCSWSVELHDNPAVLFLHMLPLSKSGWWCTVHVHMKAARTHDRKPTSPEELGLLMWIRLKNLIKESNEIGVMLCAVNDVYASVFELCRIHLKRWRTRQWKRTDCSEGAACSIWRIWALAKADTVIYPPVQVSQQKSVFVCVL